MTGTGITKKVRSKKNAANRLDGKRFEGRRMITKIVFAVCVSLATGSLGSAVSAAELRLMTGPQGGVWVPLGGQIKDMVEKALPGSYSNGL